MGNVENQSTRQVERTQNDVISKLHFKITPGMHRTSFFLQSDSYSQIYFIGRLHDGDGFVGWRYITHSPVSSAEGEIRMC